MFSVCPCGCVCMNEICPSLQLLPKQFFVPEDRKLVQNRDDSGSAFGELNRIIFLKFFLSNSIVSKRKKHTRIKFELKKKIFSFFYKIF